MELNKTEFKNAVARISSAIPKKAIIPNLCNVLFESNNGIIKLTGSDLNHICHTQYNAGEIEDVSFTVNCEKLKKALSMRGDKITINYVDEPSRKIVIGNGITTVELECLPVHDFPAFNKPETSHTRKVSATKFVEIVNKVKFAADKNGARVNLQGVYVNFTETEMQVFCTDGKRIAYCSEPCSDLVEKDSFGFNLPMKSVDIINNLNVTPIKNEDGTTSEPEVVISVSETTVEFFQNDFNTVSKVITEKPPVESILNMINKNSAIREPIATFKIESSKILESLRFVNSLCDSMGGVNMSKTGSNLKFAIKEGSQTVEDTVEVENIKNGEVNISCNLQYLMEPISNFSVNEVEFQTGESTNPFFVIAGNYKYLLMPLRGRN